MPSPVKAYPASSHLFGRTVATATTSLKLPPSCIGLSVCLIPLRCLCAFVQAVETPTRCSVLSSTRRIRCASRRGRGKSMSTSSLQRVDQAKGVTGEPRSVEQATLERAHARYVRSCDTRESATRLNDALFSVFKNTGCERILSDFQKIPRKRPLRGPPRAAAGGECQSKRRGEIVEPSRDG
jgi:hypothetical protein